MYSSFSQMKSYCTFSIQLNRLKKGSRTTEYILFILFLKSHFNRFFLSLHSVLSLLSVLSLHFLLKHETGLGFGLRLETPAWWLIGGLGLLILAWWWLGLAHPTSHAKPCRADPNGLEVVESCRSRPGGVGLGLEVVEPCQLVAKKLILVAEKLI
jgi:hypothetical protein